MDYMANFQRKIEDFSCENCGHFIVGNGYTNHCSMCLWSKHVDINPGDRLSECKGMMKPVSVEQKDGDYIILHVCQKCGSKKPNKVSKNDDFDAILSVAKSSILSIDQ
jgi:ribosomal protein L32